MTEQTDTPVDAGYPHPTMLEQIKAFVGDLARPFAIIGSTVGVNTALVIVANKLTGDAAAVAIFVGAAFTGLATLYGAKSWENSQTAKQAAAVEIAKVTPAPSSPEHTP